MPPHSPADSSHSAQGITALPITCFSVLACMRLHLLSSRLQPAEGTCTTILPHKLTLPMHAAGAGLFTRSLQTVGTQLHRRRQSQAAWQMQIAGAAEAFHSAAGGTSLPKTGASTPELPQAAAPSPARGLCQHAQLEDEAAAHRWLFLRLCEVQLILCHSRQPDDLKLNLLTRQLPANGLPGYTSSTSRPPHCVFVTTRRQVAAHHVHSKSTPGRSWARTCQLNADSGLLGTQTSMHSSPVGSLTM